MANTAQTSAATAAEQETIKAIEQKLSALSSIMEGFKTSVEDFSKAMTDEKSQFFQNMSNIMFGSMQRNDADRRAYEEAKAQNEEARSMAMGDRGPERGQAGFWEAAFATTPEKPEEVQAKATIKALTSSDVKKHLQEAFSTATIKTAVREGDARTTGEKAFDFLGLGFVNKIKNKFQDRNLVKEEKANKKDTDAIARGMKEKSRLEAAIRRKQGAGASDEEISGLMEKLRGVSDSIKDAEVRIDARKKPIDPYADLAEKEGGLFAAVKSPLLPDAAGKKSGTAGTSGGMPGTDSVEPARYDSRLKDALANPSGLKTTGKVGDGAAEKDSAGMVTGTLDTVAKVAVVVDTVAKVAGAVDGVAKVAGIVGNKPASGFDEKEAADIERRLDTQIRPEFYQEGTKFFKKANGGKLFEGLESGGGGLLGGKGGLYAAGGALVAASLGTIAFAGKKFKDLMDTKAQVKDNLNKMTEGNIENNKKLKKGWNDDMRDSLSELLEAEKNLRNAGFFNGDEQKAVEAAKQKFEREKKKLAAFRQSAQAAGIDINDADAMNKYKEEYDRKQKTAVAGNTGQTSAPTAGTPGGQVNTDKVETAEERAARDEEATYRAVKRAQLDDEVQKQNLENAKATGQQIDQSLVGRK